MYKTPRGDSLGNKYYMIAVSIYTFPARSNPSSLGRRSQRGFWVADQGKSQAMLRDLISSLNMCTTPSVLLSKLALSPQNRSILHEHERDQTQECAEQRQNETSILAPMNTRSLVRANLHHYGLMGGGGVVPKEKDQRLTQHSQRTASRTMASRRPVCFASNPGLQSQNWHSHHNNRPCSCTCSQTQSKYQTQSARGQCKGLSSAQTRTA